MPSKAYVRAMAQMREFHRTRKTFSGNGVLKHVSALLEFNQKIGAKSGIDYGCGKGAQYEAWLNDPGGTMCSLEAALGYAPYKYDPAVPEFEKPPPEPADLVWCVDVLECVPEQDMGDVIDDLFRLAIKGLFVTVASYPAKKTLPNGQNAHVTVKPREWWVAKFDDGARRAGISVHDTSLQLVLLVA